MLTKEDKIEIIQNQCQKHEITAYEIGEKTSISTSSAQKILAGKNTSPKNKTLNIILDYIQEKIVGTEIGAAKEPTPSYNKPFESLPIDAKLNSLFQLLTTNNKLMENNAESLKNAKIEIANIELAQLEQSLAIEKQLNELSTNSQKSASAG